MRWSPAAAPAGAEEELAAYVAGTSHARFSSMAGLGFTTWRMRRGEWFEGCDVVAVAEGAAGFVGGWFTCGRTQP